MMKKILGIIVTLAILTVIVLLKYFMESHLGQQVTLIQISKCLSFFITTLILILFLPKFYSIEKGGSVIQYFFVILIFLSMILIPSHLVLEPLTILTINKINQGKIVGSVNPNEITFKPTNKWYHNEESAYYVEISTKKDTFQLRINNSLKQKIITTGKINNLKKGRLGLYFIEE